MTSCNVYAGIAGYGVDLPTKPLMELDLTAGIRPKFGPLTFDFGVIGYVYPDEAQFIVDDVLLTPRDTDFLEVDLAAFAAGEIPAIPVVEIRP